MSNSCNSCGCNNGNDPLLETLINLFAPLGCGCRTCNRNSSLVLVNGLGTVTMNGNNGGCGCGNNNGNGILPISGLGGLGGNNNGCGCGNNNGCGCGNTYDAYYVRQYALCSCCNN